ncbi:capsule biosynthesis protein [Maritimibacter sp. 55A14]|uniref:capsule biosynthesis protein n=1 Tax=Maritimibacter sp. 55A14 TaxID=2174844 RepID=UPI000D606D5A|nr:capsule biosynthesis protein [Maritimibacter sp. 55A14]PWE29461.1 capsule biosynthesis protein [Maritimibacter sp. 55A14]
MKPRAKKFRIRRSAPAGEEQARAANGETAPSAAEAAGAAGGAAQASEPQERAPLSPEQELEAIRAENLTGRQLRMARRIAQKHGLEPASDIDAVRLLRRRGIDPFQKSQMLELVVSETGNGRAETPPSLPSTVRNAQPPSSQIAGSENRAREIRRIQRDIARRRRIRMGLLALRLAFFVLLPTALAGYYYFNIATPMYSTRTEFLIQKADAAQASGLGGLFAGTQFATTQDSIAVQGYLQSREAMQRLNDDLGFKAHFSQPDIDPIQRLSADASDEAAYKLYKKNVKIGYDPTEGFVKMEVIAADPALAKSFSEALISYAEERVDSMTQRLRGDQMKGSRDSYEEAERKMREAQQRVLDLQQKRGVLSAEMEVSAQMSQISSLEVDLQRERLRLQELMANERPNQTRVDVSERKIARLEDAISGMRAELTEGNGDSVSLATISGELVVAEADLQTRQAMLSQALQQLETARIEANRQVRYLSVGVSPVAPDAAAYPRAFENTVLAFLIFGGIYLMVSLTASILREQVSA